MDKVKEYTQGVLAFIVLGVTGAALMLGRALPTEWWVTTSLIVGFYFGRTNATSESKPPA